MNPTLIIILVAVLLIAMVIYSVRQQTSLAKYFLLGWGAVNFLYAAFVLASARTVIHEIEGGLALLIGTLACGLASVIDGLDHIRKAQQREVQRGESQGITHSPAPQSPAENSVIAQQLHTLERDFMEERIGPDEYRQRRKVLIGE